MDVCPFSLIQLCNLFLSSPPIGRAHPGAAGKAEMCLQSSHPGNREEHGRARLEPRDSNLVTGMLPLLRKAVTFHRLFW